MTLVIFLQKNKKYADYASSVTFIKSAKIMLVFPNYAKNYASTIYKGLSGGSSDTCSHFMLGVLWWTSIPSRGE